MGGGGGTLYRLLGVSAGSEQQREQKDQDHDYADDAVLTDAMLTNKRAVLRNARASLDHEPA